MDIEDITKDKLIDRLSYLSHYAHKEYGINLPERLLYEVRLVQIANNDLFCILIICDYRTYHE